MSTFGTETERIADATYKAAYAASLAQYQQDDDRAAFEARNKAAADARKAAVEPVWASREAILEHIDD